MKYVIGLLAVIGGVVAVAFGGLLVKPTLFASPSMPADQAPSRVVAIPSDLPTPVARWYRKDFPDGLPVFDTVVMRGTGVMRMGPVSLPFRHYYESRPGRGFYRKMDITWFNIAFLHGLDTCVDGVGVMNTPVGTVSGPRIDQGANAVAWLELLSTPGNLEQSEARWEPVDDDTARLVFPSNEGTDTIDITFDPESAAPVSARCFRYREADSTEKAGWTARMKTHGRVEGNLGPVSIDVDAQWDGDPRPWATFVYTSAWGNADVPGFDEAVRSGGVKIGDAR